MPRSLDPVQLGSIEQFCKAAELGSFRAAAEALGLTPAAVSRAVQRLESRLGVRLFVRTTRRIALTPEGTLYYAECRQALNQIEEVERALTGRQDKPHGLVRISVPTTWGHYRLVPLLPSFRQVYPDIRLEVQIANRNIDFVEEGYDLAIRLGVPEDSRLVARLLDVVPLGVYAAPGYLARRGVPQSLDELAQHDCIRFVLPSTGRPLPWLFRDGDRELSWLPPEGITMEGDVLGCLHHAIHGGGVFQGLQFIAAPALASGELIEVLPHLAGRSRPFHLLYPQHRHLPARVRALVDFLLDRVPRSGQGTEAAR